MKNRKSKQILLSVIGIFLLIVATVGVSLAFFNYTRTGSPNTLQVGRIAFNSTQTNIELENVFPTLSTNLNSSNSDTATITITGDTSYSGGIEYKVTLESVNNSINGKEVPISFNVTANNLGTKDTSYYTNRGGENPIYNLTETGQVEDGKYILVGYIPSGEDGVNGSVDVTAFIDASNVAISDTVSRIEDGNFIYGETPGDWIAGREVFTTSEWNSLNSNPLSFKIRVEANEGIWVEEPKFIVLKKLSDTYEWYTFIQNATSIEFSTNPEVPNNALTSFDATDITSSGPVTVYTIDDGLGNNTYKAVICADDVIYAPEDSANLFAFASKLKTFDTSNFRVDNASDLQYMFYRCTSLVNIDLSSWNVSNVTSMIAMFSDCTSIEDFSFLFNWDTSNVELFGRLFFKCSKLENVNFLINWNTSKGQNMEYMFANCTNLININGLANWDTSNVTNMLCMFGSCTNLIDFSPLENWNTSKVENMSGMFAIGDSNYSHILDANIFANWNVSNVTNMSYIFQNRCLNSYIPLRNWNVSKVQNFAGMFNGTPSSSITALDGLENWNVSSAIDMKNMFIDNVSLTDASAINNWDINSNIDFTQMFASTPVHPEFTKVSGTWDSNGTFTPNA